MKPPRPTRASRNADADANVDAMQHCLDLLPLALLRLGADGEITWLNPQAQALLASLAFARVGADGPAFLDALSPGLGTRWQACRGQRGLLGPPQPGHLTQPGASPRPLRLQLLRPDGAGTLLSLEELTPPPSASPSKGGPAPSAEPRVDPRIDPLTDPLTGLLNQRGLAARLCGPTDPGVALASGGAPGALTRGLPVAPAWIALDIDHFQRLNDAHGNDRGDDVLRAVARALQAAAREGDMLARRDADAFLLHLPAAPEVVARRVAERLRLHLQALGIEAGRRKLHITASFGVALQGPGESWPAALARADAALHQARQDGHNRVHVAAPAGPAVHHPCGP